MADQPIPRREHPSTYFVQDRSNQEEMTRVHIQDQMLTMRMGGVLPEQPDPTLFERVLDVGCGTGDWLIEAAKIYPTMSELIGVDISGKMLDYARSQAKAQQVSNRVRFAVMDALRLLEFPDAFFHLVNHRCGSSYLRTWDWPKLLAEYQRVCKPGGVIRLTEGGFITQSSSPTLVRLNRLFHDAFLQSGHFFASDGQGITSDLVRLMQQHGIQDVQTRTHHLQYRPGIPEWQSFYENMKMAHQTALPFFRKWTRVPDDYDALYQQMLREMQQPDFVATWSLLTAWGTNSTSNSSKDFLRVR